MLHRKRLLNFNYKRKLTFKITFVLFPSLVAFVLQAQSPCRTRSEGTESNLTPPHAWYYRISPNSRTLVILLQVDLASGDEPEIVCEGCYETKDTSIFAWSSVPGVGHYCWLRGPICRLPPNSKADYLVRTIRRILNFLQL
jgi:hypothetical protein